VHYRGQRVPHFTFEAVTSDIFGEILDLGETLLVASATLATNTNLGKVLTAVFGIGAPALTRHFIACRMGAIYPSFGGAMNYIKKRRD
jgi:hypothetical protein